MGLCESLWVSQMNNKLRLWGLATAKAAGQLLLREFG